MTLWKRGGVYWTYVWVDGIRHAKSTGTANRRRAERIDHCFKEELSMKREGLADPQPEMTFGELAARFLAEGSPLPYHRERLKMLLPYWSAVMIGRITKARADDYRKERHAQKHLSDTTVNRDLEVVRRLLFWAVDMGYLMANPLSRVRMVRERRKRRPVMSLREEAKLLMAASKHLRKIAAMAFDTGMRRGELLAQRWEDVDFDRDLLFVTHSKTPEGEAREIPFTKRVKNLLRRARKPAGLVFVFNKKPIHSIKTAWATALRKSGIRRYRFHDLRHTFNTRLMEAGVIQEVRKALMGHSSGEDTNSLYTHVELPAKRKAIRKLELWVEEERRKKKEENEKKKEGQTTDITLTFLLGFVIHLVLVFVIPNKNFKNVYLTAHMMLFLSTFLNLTLPTVMRISGTPLLILSSTLCALYWTLTPAIVRVIGRSFLGGDFTLGHHNQVGAFLASRVAKLFGKVEDDAEDLKLPKSISILRDNTISMTIIMGLIFMGIGLAAGHSAIIKIAGKDNWIIWLILRGFQFTAGIVVLLSGVRMFIGSIVPAFKGISERIIPKAVPALDCPTVYPFSPVGAMLGFLASVPAAILVTLILLVVHSSIVVFPSPFITFFDGCTIGVFGNKFGGWRGALAAGFVSSFIAHLGCVAIYPLMGSMYGSGLMFSNIDFTLVWLPLLYILKVIAAAVGFGV